MMKGNRIAFSLQWRSQALAMSLTSFIALSLPACSIAVKRPINVYPGAGLSIEQVSVLKVAIGAKIESIDGQPRFSCTECEMHLLPGAHRIAVRELTPSSMNGQWLYVDAKPKDMDFVAAQGHVYSVSCPDFKIVLVDDTTQATLFSEQPVWAAK
jgi:hypothetical protein